MAFYTFASDRGYPLAQHNLASLYEHGQGVHKNDVEAVRLFREAAGKNIANSQFSLAMHLKDGTGEAAVSLIFVYIASFVIDSPHLCSYPGVDQDLQECMKWLGKAAEQGHAKVGNL